MKRETKSVPAIRRQKAEELLKRNPSKSGPLLSESDMQKLIHELEVHQIELEMQNEELSEAKLQADVATEKYSELYDFAPSGYFTLSKAGKIIELNLSGATMLGKERSRLKNSLFNSFVSDATKPVFNLFLGKVFSSKVRETCEVSLSISGNETMYVYLSGIFTENAEHCLVTVLDITERKRTENALLESEIKYRAFFENSMDAILLTSPDGKIQSANQAACSMFGYSENELIKLGRSGVVDTSDPRLSDLLAERTLKGKARGELSFIRKDGTSFPAEISSAIFKNPEDFKCTCMIIRDITERVHAEESLRKQKEEFETIFNLVPDQIWYKDTHNNFIRVNQQVCQDIGMTNDQIEGHSAEELFPSFAQQYFQDDCEVIYTREPKMGITEQVNTANGEVRWVHSDKIPVFGNDGEVNGLIVVVQDITERKQAEEKLIIANKELAFQTEEKGKRADELIIANKELVFQNEEKEKQAVELTIAKEKAEESDRLKSAFLANMSHEVRTPLNSIIGFSELLADPFFEEEQKNEFIQSIITSGNNLLSIISDIMDFSKMESGEIKIRKSQINVQKFITTVKEEFAVHTEEKKLELKLILPGNAEETVVFADAERLRQIFTNLMSNAIKFTANGSIEIGFRPKGKMVEFYIMDTGIGIPAEYHDTIFERFRQVETEKTRKYGGNGLGLAISKNLVEIMGGKIWLESESGKGSVFYFTLPAQSLT